MSNPSGLNISGSGAAFKAPSMIQVKGDIYMTERERQRIIKANMAIGMTEAEAIQCVEDDIRIDKGEKCDWEVELTPEQKKAQRQARKADRTVTDKKQTRTRAENPDKRALMELFDNTLAEYAGVEDVVVTNVERELTFNYNGTAYKITLSAPRK